MNLSKKLTNKEQNFKMAEFLFAWGVLPFT